MSCRRRLAEYPIDLATALRLADMVNPTINRARTVILEALAQQLTARTLLVPSLNAGGNYHGHNGDLQRSSGKIISLSEQSLYLGAGAGTLAAETVRIPGVSILTPLTDAWFEPLVARQRVIASRFNARSTENDILMEVAVYHLELIRHNVLLEANRLSESQAYQIVQTTRQYAMIGQGRQADADRARAEWRYRRADVIDAEQGVGVASARLAQRLNLDPSVRLQPMGGPLVPPRSGRAGHADRAVDPDGHPATSRPGGADRRDRPGASTGSRRRSAGPFCRPSGWASAAVPSAAAATSHPRSSATSPAGPTSMSACTGPCSTSAWATSR